MPSTKTTARVIWVRLTDVQDQALSGLVAARQEEVGDVRVIQRSEIIRDLILDGARARDLWSSSPLPAGAPKKKVGRKS